MNPALLRLFQGAATVGRRGLDVAHRGSRYAAQVPAGEKFFRSPLAGVGRMTRLAFWPYIGRLNYAKHALLGGTALSGASSALQAASSKSREWASRLPDSHAKDVLMQDLEGVYLPPLRIATEVAGIPGMRSLDGLSPQHRDQLRGVSRKGLLAGAREWADSNRGYHPQGWLEKKWQEPIKTVTQPANKLLAEGLYRGLDSLPDSWYPQVPKFTRR